MGLANINAFGTEQMRFARMQGKYHPDQLRGWDDVYGSLDEFAIAEDRETRRESSNEG